MWDMRGGTAASIDKPAGSGQWAYDACPPWRLAFYQDSSSAWSLMVHGFSDSVLMN